MKTKETIITYGESDNAFHNYTHFLISHIKSCNIKSVCELGGGANPQLDTNCIKELGLNYAILDISETELNKAPDEYQKINADITSNEIALECKFDLMFSKMLAEHIQDAEQFHKNVFKLLNPGGIAIHFFPTLYAFPFVVNRVFPEKLTSILLDYFSPRDVFQNAKFPAYYSWCRGPTELQIRKFKNLGYEVIEYKGFYGHSNYYNKISFIKKLHEIKTQYLLNNSNPIFTSYACVVLKKPNK